VWFVPTEADRLDALSAAEALAGRPLDERETIIAHLWGGLTFRQIGELAGISAATAFRRYESALCALRSRLEKTSDV
jgi:RNA polymerase sigma-70 factor (ECF subfamily)